jgi:hypothetical protein
MFATLPTIRGLNSKHSIEEDRLDNTDTKSYRLNGNDHTPLLYTSLKSSADPIVAAHKLLSKIVKIRKISWINLVAFYLINTQ